METALLFIVTAVAEIGGCYVCYLWLRKGATPQRYELATPIPSPYTSTRVQVPCPLPAPVDTAADLLCGGGNL